MNIQRELNDRIFKLTQLIRTLHHNGGQNDSRGYAQDRALKAIAAQEGISQRKLTQQLNAQPSSMSEVLKKLEDSGLIERRSNPGDRRQMQLYPSREGRALALRLDKDAPLPDPFDELNRDEQQLYLELTDRMIEAMKRSCAERGISVDRPPYNRGGRDFRKDRRPEDFRGDFKRGNPDGRNFHGGRRDSDFHRFEDSDEEYDLHSALRGGRDHGRHPDSNAKRKSDLCDGCGKGCKLTSPGCGHGARLARERGIKPRG